MMQPWLSLAIVVLVLLAITLWCVWWQWQYRNDTFIRAQKEIQRANGGQDPYDSTRILMLGNEEDNRLLCRTWSLTDGTESWFGQWWFDAQCSLLCVSHSLQTTEKKRLIRQNDWQKMVAALVKSRPQRPLDALILTLPLADLQEDAYAYLSERCQQIQQVCGLSLPVYLLISGMEAQDGVRTLLRQLPPQAQGSAIGSAISCPREAVWKPQWIDDALENTRFSLRQAITELGALSGSTPASLFRLPEFFPSLAPALHAGFDKLLSSNARDEPPLLRGIWFVAHHMVGEKPQMAFCQSLLHDKIIAERGLALPVRRLLRLNLRRHFIVLAGYSALCIVWLVVMLWRWPSQHANALLLHNQLQSLATQIAPSDTPGERAAARYWRMVNDVPQWHFRSLIWPGSLFSRTDSKLSETFHNVTLSSLLAPAMNNICLQHQSATRGDGLRERDDLLAEDRYRQILYLLEQTKQMETRYLPLLQLTQVKRPTVQTLAEVSSTVWGSNVEVAALPATSELNEMLATLPVSQMNLPDASELTQRNSEQFTRETRRWLAQIYDNASLETYAGQLDELLLTFSSDEEINADVVRLLMRQISRLQNALTTLNSLSQDAAHSPARIALDTLLTQAQALRLLDRTTIHDLLNDEKQLRQRLMLQIDRSPLHFSTLTAQSTEGEFHVSPDILALQKSLRDLLNQPFWQRGAGLPLPQSPGYPGDPQLQQAATLFAGYQRYSEQLPDSLWRPRLNELAQNAVERAIRQTLYRGVPTTAPARELDTGNADRVIAALTQINRPALASALRQQVAAQIIARVNDEGGARLPDIRPPSVSAATPEQAQASGQQVMGWAAAQTEQISATLTRYQQPIEWLSTQRPWLSAAQNQQIARWVSSQETLMRLQQQDPTSAPAQLQTLAATLPTLTAQNCQSELASFRAAGQQDFYSASLNALLSASVQNCQQLRQQGSVGVVQNIFTLYNNWLAGRFPFTARPHAPDADVDRVRELASLLAKLPPETLADQPALIRQLAAAQPLLSALVSPDGVVVRVNWRMQRNQEAGADQIVDWQLSGNQQTLTWPGGDSADLHWRSGDNLTFSLRWAANSAWRPVQDAAVVGLSVAGGTARWRWQGAWALLRMTDQQRVGGALAQPVPLRFSLPVSDGQQRSRTTVNIQFALLNAQDNAPLPWVILTEQGFSGEHQWNR
ncbi:type VI secretion protein IcmF/TssM N-terminal domain-containing protein [Citrobacter farmeri]|uniref:Type VI secretion system component TssM1 N-terminal domain-containing protein n=1 Tax=Citrobacter amalonaticus Y19 TaxID=1261127 RepID=A0A0F6TX18_CITAM|nr:type VI secretion protein IcmF/TssM N-terminal domain-containing protein [Citrobacter amalonaticus]AKE60036.1 hypothetical protein F384_16455 [Citrobacter amalonaticus Y19]EKV5653097.1 hypothetical protein [Citrobacter farmeri]